MKKIALIAFRLYFKLYSLFFPKEAGKKAFLLFQKTRRIPLRKQEIEFYKVANKFEVSHPRENIHCYSLGSKDNELVVLVHGWESNAGSMGAIATSLVARGFYVVLLDLPAHGKSQLVRTNLRECREALRALVYHLRPSKPFSIISHSFGSAVSSFAFTGSRYKVKNFIMLTSPNRLVKIFEEFKSMIGLGDRAFEYLLNLTDTILNEPIRAISVEAKASHVDYENLILIHDQYDKILPYKNSQEIKDSLPNSKLFTLSNAGHYRMLTSKEVITIILNQLHPEEIRKSIKELQEEIA